ncbi:MAG: hypothetical protein AAFZ99_17615 [Pseudomonadota bacterium]
MDAIVAISLTRLDAIGHGPCYMFDTMIRSLLICTALVASSGAGAVALSALHDAAGDRNVRTLAPVPVATVEPRFVIPTFAPAPATPEVVEVALRDAPVLPAVESADVAPVPLATPVAAPVPSFTDVVVVAPQAKPVAKPQARASTKSVQTARAVRNETVRTFKQRSTRPIIVAQAPAFSAEQPAALQPDWVIGVYR